MVYYLKVNREKEYVLTNLKHWIDAASVSDENIIYVVCDNTSLKKTIVNELGSMCEQFEFIESDYVTDDIMEIVNNTTLGTWGKIAYAHLTTFSHAKKNGYEFFWNIDADDTFFCLDPIRLSDLLLNVEKKCKAENVHICNLDMWHSISVYEGWSEIPHWSFGVTFTDNTIDWFSILKAHMNDPEYHNMRKLHSNIDWYFTYLSSQKDLLIQSFYVENLKFIHYYSNFIDYPHKGTMYLYKNKKIVFPIIKYCFGLDEMGEIDVAGDDIKIEMDILDSEATFALIGNCKEKEVFAKELKKIKEVDMAANRRLINYKKIYGYKNIVIYGVGDYFYRNYEMIKKADAEIYLCDSDPQKWGKEIIDGVFCMSPEEMMKLENYVVIISVEQVTTSFEIARSLRGLGVTEIDHIDNLRRYLQGV